MEPEEKIFWAVPHSHVKADRCDLEYILARVEVVFYNYRTTFTGHLALTIRRTSSIDHKNQASLRIMDPAVQMLLGAKRK